MEESRKYGGIPEIWKNPRNMEEQSKIMEETTNQDQGVNFLCIAGYKFGGEEE